MTAGTTTNQTCLGSICNGVSQNTIYASYISCTIDVFGNPCSCCFNLINYNGSLIGECADNFDLTNNTRFKTFAANKANYNSSQTTTTNHESCLILSLVMMILMALLWFIYSWFNIFKYFYYIFILCDIFGSSLWLVVVYYLTFW